MIKYRLNPDWPQLCDVCVCMCASVSDLARWTNKAAHVLHHTDDRQLDLLTEPDLLPHVLQWYLLEREKETEIGRQKRKRAKKERKGGNQDPGGKSERERISSNCFLFPRNGYHGSLEKKNNKLTCFRLEMCCLKKKRKDSSHSSHTFVIASLETRLLISHALACLPG